MRFLAAAGLLALAIPHAFAATSDEVDPACNGAALTGSVRDTTQAFIPGASLSVDGGKSIESGADGRYRIPCVANGDHKLTISMTGFTTKVVAVKVPHGALDVVLAPGEVETTVAVDAEQAGLDVSSTSVGPSRTIAGQQLQMLADDPDDLLQQLQQLAAASGGNPANATISVNGFQDSSKLPPKSTIAYIKVNPDLFSSEYREPPFGGGRIEVYTKAGQPTYHGALFMTNGSPWENARDPFSTSKAAIGKQRYGFELTGPIRKEGSDFSMTLEHRAINEFAAVDAATLDAGGNQVETFQNVPQPQALWVGEGRLDWQLSPKNTFMTTFSANSNEQDNLGAGGTTLAENAYNDYQYEYSLRFVNITTISAKAMHEARVQFKWDGEEQDPNSLLPQVQVAGAFTGGGVQTGQQRSKELNVEVDDDMILTPKNHTLKFGTQLMTYNDHDLLPTYFNGSYTFGGGTAPVLAANGTATGQTATITGIEQYRRAQLGLPGGTPTAFTGVTGTPNVDFTLWTNAVFIQDDWNVGKGVHIASGVRYYWQNDPTILNSAVPRVGILWSPDKKKWTLHAHAGMFSGRYGKGDISEVLREDGTARITSTIYNPVYNNPFAGATPIYQYRVFSPHLSNLTWGAENLGGTYAFWKGFNFSYDLIYARIWNYTRSENINSPINGLPTGPRPGPANTNILQMNNSGSGGGNAVFVGLENHELKRFQFFVGTVRVDLVDDTDDNELGTPQKTGVNKGEFAYRTNQGVWQSFGNATVKLPEKVDLSAEFNGQGEAHYNITTGFDNNGDGQFNDRPQFAPAGAPSCTSQPNATPCYYPTRYGNLTLSGGTGSLNRNLGVMPWQVYLNLNLQRTFALTRNPKANHPQTLQLNVRSANVLNHNNVKSVGGVLGSPTFGQPYASDHGRRVEIGARYSF
jgi:hypothetical protein